jgi:putative lipoic acid-binding regulatory protein
MAKENKLEYPRTWEFCVIGKDKEKLHEAIKECLPDHFDHKYSKTHKSLNSQKAKVIVSSEEERNELYKKLQNHPEVKYIL